MPFVDFPAQPYAESYDMCLPQFVVPALLLSDSTILTALVSASVTLFHWALNSSANSQHCSEINAAFDQGYVTVQK